MKNTALVFTGFSLIGLIATFFLFSTTEINPFQLFMFAVLSIAGFSIGLCNLILRSKHKATKWVRIGSLLLFGATVLIFMVPSAFNTFWNSVLCLHIILIGFSLFQLVPPAASQVFKISKGLIAISTLLFSTIILFKVSAPEMYSVLFYSLFVLSVLIGFLFFFARFFVKEK